MAITVKHTPVGALGRLAVQAGQARGQQVRMSRDIQLTQIAMAAEDRVAAIGMAAQDRSFALQQAAATQMAKKRPITREDRSRKQELRRAVSQAKTAGVYTPAQIKQMQIFADMGDAGAVRSILGKLDRPSARRVEIQEQLGALEEFSRGDIAGVQPQLNEINKQLSLRFTPQAQQFLRENPKFAEPEIKELLDQQQQLEAQVTEAKERIAGRKQLLQLGLTIPEQMAFEARQEAQLTKQEESQLRRLERQAEKVTKITDVEELAIDTMRDREKERRSNIGREISRLSKDLAPFAKEKEKDTEERIKPIQEQIRQLELERIASFGMEKNAVETFLRSRGPTDLKKVVTDATGQRWRFTGRYREDGKPIYEVIE